MLTPRRNKKLGKWLEIAGKGLHLPHPKADTALCLWETSGGQGRRNANTSGDGTDPKIRISEQVQAIASLLHIYNPCLTLPVLCHPSSHYHVFPISQET
jgi:hypothetical protein